MTFLEFQKTFANMPVIPVVEIRKAFPRFDRNALTRWQKAGYLVKIRNGFYRLKDSPRKGSSELFFIANRIYQPSYISLQSALSWYGFIPEGVFTITSVSTLKTQNFQTPEGVFAYQTVRKNLFFGYRLEHFGAWRFKIATPGKALLDLLYLNPHLDSEAHFVELRLNFWELKEHFNRREFENYLSLAASPTLTDRAKKFLKFLVSHDVIN